MRIDEHWSFYKVGEEEKKVILDLPHDAMIHEERRNENLTGKNSSYFDGCDYVYEKDLEVSSLEEGMKAYLVFEGIYQKAVISVNDKEAGKCDYGYMDTILDITSLLQQGNNHIKVEVSNSNQPNSRWYTGSGIFRHVNFYLLSKSHILFDSIRIKTVDYTKGLVNVRYELSEEGTSTLEILDEDGTIVKSMESIGDKPSIDVEIPNVKLWNLETPHLYTFRVTFKGHVEEVRSGIRNVTLDPNQGLLLNGKKVLLLGCCVHHDLSMLGAANHDFAEQRRVRLLKNAGYNAIRSAHNPCSRGLLNACDEQGMLVMDEYADSWYIHKTKYDVANHVSDYWKEDLKKIVDKDYNHPCVIMYSTGNEVAETCEKRGIQLTKDFNEYLHSLDDTRYTTCGINVFFNALYSVGLGQYSDKKSESEAKEKKPQKKKKASGSEFFNNLAGMLGAEFMKTMAKLPLVDRKTKDAFANMDVAGYNYGIKRYKHDFKKYPNRFIVGSETFCSDAGKFMAAADKYPRLLGDFVWTGMDYLGETGLGAMINLDKIKMDDIKDWLLADSGVLDFMGDDSSQSDYTKVAFRKEIVKLGVVSPYDYRSSKTPSSWRFTRAMHSWSFKGEEGNTTSVEVYFNSPIVEVYFNDKLQRTFKKNDSCFKKFKLAYQPGTLKAVAKDENGTILGEDVLTTADVSTKITTVAEKKEIAANEYSYIHLYVTDDDGILKPLQETKIKVKSIENGELIAFGSAVAYNPDSFFKDETMTFNGKMMAILKPINSNPIHVTFSSEFGESEVTVAVK